MKRNRGMAILCVLVSIVVVIGVALSLFVGGGHTSNAMHIGLRQKAPKAEPLPMPKARLIFSSDPHKKSVDVLHEKMPCRTQLVSMASLADSGSALWYVAQTPPGVPDLQSRSEGHLPLLEGVLRERWLHALKSGVVKYSPWSIKVRPVYDAEGGRFVLRYSPGRATRPSSLDNPGQKVHAVPVQLPFDSSGITFHRFTHGEIILGFSIPSVKAPASAAFVQCMHKEHRAQTTSNPAATHNAPHGSIRLDEGPLRGAVHIVTANQFPIGPYSGLLAPFVLEDRPQVLTADAMEVLLYFAAEFSLSGWRFGFNSLGAGASVNHLHFQFFHLDSHSGRGLPVEQMRSTAVKRPKSGTQLWVLKGWPLRAMVFRKLQVESAPIIANCAEHLRSLGLPHTLLIAGNRAFLFPRKPIDASPDFGGKPGLLESSGEYIVASITKFKTTKAHAVRSYFAQNVTVDEAQFQSIVSKCSSFFPADIDGG